MWIGDIVENKTIIPYFNTSNVDMAKFVNSHKIVAQRNAFSNLQMRKMRTKSFGHGGLKCPFSQVKGDLDFKKRTNSPYNKKNNKEKVVVIVMKEEDEESEGLKNIEQIMKYYI